MRRTRRRGFTILEILVVMAIILLLGAILLPTVGAFWGNNRTKASANMLQARLADARSYAIAQGRPYQVLASPDGTQVKVAPDASEPPEQIGSETPSYDFSAESTFPIPVTISPIYTGADSTASSDASGWIRLVTFLADGTCREDSMEVHLIEEKSTTIVVRVRGLTGDVSVNPMKADGTSGGRSK